MTAFYTRNRLVHWSLLILVVLNLILLAIIWYPRLTPGKDETIEPIKPERPNKAPGNDRIIPFLKRELNFSQQQVKRFLQLRAEHFRKMTQMRRQIDDLRKELMDHLLEEKPDPSEVNRLAAELGQKMAAHEKAVFSHFRELIGLCDANQKQKFKTLLSEILWQLAPPDKRSPQQDRPISRPEESSQPPGVQKPFLREPGLPTRQAEDRSSRLRHLLRLTDTQTEKLRSILNTAREKLEKIPLDPRYRSHDERREAKNQVLQWEAGQIEALLTDQQKTLYREIEKRDERNPENPPPPPY